MLTPTGIIISVRVNELILLLTGVGNSDFGHPKSLYSILPDIPVVLVITLVGVP